MNNGPEYADRDGAVSRRTFLKVSLGLGVAAVVVPSVGSVLSGCAKKEASADLTMASAADQTQHTHTVTVPGADIDSSPAQKTYASTVDFGHSHEITLIKADFEKLKQGQTVTVASTVTGAPPHLHNWNLRKA